MTDADLRKRIEDTILDGRRRWGLRSLEEAYAQYEKASPEGRVRIKRDRNLHFYFITKYTAIVGFYEYVERECSKAATYVRLRRMIIDTILRSIINEHGADLRAFDKSMQHWTEAVPEGTTSDSEGKERYTRRRAQDIFREAVPGEFVFVGDDITPPSPDLRLRPVKTVHAPGPLPSSPQREKAQWALEVEEAALAANVDWLMYKEVGAALRFLSPTYLRSLVQFRQIVRHVLDGTSTDTPEERERRSVLRELLLQGLTMSLVALHHDVASQVVLRWWEKRKEPMQKNLIRKAFPFHLNQSRIAESTGLLRELGFDSPSTFGFLQLPALFLFAIGQSEDAIVLWRYFAKWREIPSFERGIAADNVAVLLARQSHWKLAIPFFNQAIASYDEAKDEYRKAVVLKNRGEARLRAGARAGADDMVEAERIGDSLAPESRFAVNWNLAIAAMRLKDKAALRRHLKRCLKDHDSADPELVIVVCDMLEDPRNQ